MIYWRPATVACMEAVHALRAEGRSVFFTIDAGPQVKAVCAPDDAPAVAERLQSVDGVLSLRTVGLGGGAVVTGP